MPKAVTFYTATFGLTVGRRFGADMVELLGASSPIYLLAKPAGSPAFKGAGQRRDYSRHWTPVHLDFVVDDISAAVERATACGAMLEAPVKSAAWGDLALMSDPFGHGLLPRAVPQPRLRRDRTESASYGLRPRCLAQTGDIGAGGWRRTCHSPTGSGPEGSSPNEIRHGLLVQPPASICAAYSDSEAERRPDVSGRPALEAMSENRSGTYQVLARKYRPARFDDLIGQEPMVRTLRNAFAAGRIPHAWMLTGVRGVGKTTTARILARGLNYQTEDGSGAPNVDLPTEGVHCRAIMEGRHPDVLEMDAASHTGIDDIRDIIDSARYSPVSARYKVYIIDEVHMLSKAAFNGLLKTLEEPPAHVKFVFATTEIRRVPVTVLSRCQRFDLRRVDAALLIENLASIAAKEGVETETEALRQIARAAEGSVRDAQSILDQAIAHGAGKVDAATVQDMLGLADRTRIVDLFEHVMKRRHWRRARRAAGAARDRRRPGGRAFRPRRVHPLRHAPEACARCARARRPCPRRNACAAPPSPRRSPSACSRAPGRCS